VSPNEGEQHRLGPWSRAREAARATPEGRNRYVDFLRAVSIVVVVIGHWIMAAPTVESGVAFTLSDLLHEAPWTQWLTWIFQVMPIFFVVGGYANAVSWEAARARREGYDAWVSRRLQRLVLPVVPFLLVWCVLGFIARWIGLGQRVVESGSQAAFVSTWFLAVYVLVVLTAPTMHWFWRAFGMTSFWGLVVGAALVEVVARFPGFAGVIWANYVFVWLAIHQLGYAWRDGHFSSPVRALSFALGGGAALVVLRGLANYPTSMVTVPGDATANSNPPNLALLALGVTHTGLLLAIEGAARRFLQGALVWSATVFLNGVVMTIYLWHATAMVLLVGLLEWPGGVGLRLVPNTAIWWATRVPWILVLVAVLALFLALFGRFEALRNRERSPGPTWRNLVGAVSVCLGLVSLANGGIGASNALGIQVAPVLLTLIGAALVARLRVRIARRPPAAAGGGRE